jgi:hypothetical protein
VPAQVGLVEATGVTARERVEPGAAALRRARERLAHEPEAAHRQAVEQALDDPARLRIVRALGTTSCRSGRWRR